ncbi:hypothetical protein [Micromonospora aurantiaca (nom. illeg.)]|uniref:hypothetical protein n=1 Tax=Micromonospora aurantiaca (nom. illeg.) TaxID=47850 RepID=UPI000F3DA650|nr:hypothetical protein [Micromonospora aurantiaca]RNI02037.1 hypothetical protein EEZ25_15795 [Micromonospora aurantiaca]
MGKRSRVEWHDNGALIWTWGLTLVVSGIGLLLLAVAAILWAVRAPAEVADGGGRFMVPAIFGAVALLVAVAGRITSANALRYADSTLPKVPHELGVARHVGRQRRSLRRRSGIAYLYMAVTVGGLAGAALVYWGEQPRAGSLLELALAASAVPAATWPGRPPGSSSHRNISTSTRRCAAHRYPGTCSAASPSAA